jgi:hypothetical protein
MKHFGPQFFFFLLLAAALLTLACGSSSSHIPQTVTVSPATADAASLNASIQFTATAYYNTMPSPVTPVKATWGACFQGVYTQDVSVSANGVAQCVNSGTYTVWAFVPNSSTKQICNEPANACGLACGGVVGTAQLTCP